MIFTTLCKAVGIPRRAKSKTLLLMQLTAVLLLACCLQVAGASVAQKVTITENNAPLRKVLTQIKKQTGFTFFINEQLLKKGQSVSLDVQNMPLEQALAECFKDLPLNWHIVNKTIVVSEKKEQNLSYILNAVPPVTTITGKITDAANDAPIEGATITVKGTHTSATTGKDGTFSIEAEKGSTLVITFVGFDTREVKVHSADFLKVPLTPKANESGDNVIITGFQRIKKESFTGTAITVQGDELKKINPQNILQSIQVFDPSFKVVENNIAGSNPNRLPVINVRGNTSLPTGSGEVLSRSNLSGNTNLPTFILDGYEVSLEKVYDLDINRVQSVTLLKDAAATAVYGSRAANGVLVITTIPPKEGKLQVSYNYELYPTAPDLSDYHVLNAKDKLEYERQAGLYDATKNQALSQDQLDALYYAKKENVVGGVNTYWLSQPVRTAFGQKHSAYMEGGSSSMRYGLELRYQTNPGVMKGSERNRYSAGMSLSYSPDTRFIFKNTLTVTQVNSKESPWGSFSDYVKTNPYYAKTDSNGNVVQALETWQKRTGAANSIENYTVLNPMYNATLQSFNKNNYLELIDAFSAEWNITKALRLRGQISLNKTKSTSDEFVSPYANEFYFYSTADYNKRGRYNYGNSDFTSVDGNLLVSYNKQLNDHYINFTAGGNFRTAATDSKSFTAIGFTNDRFTNIGYAGSYPAGSTPASSAQKERLAGALASINYTWQNKYLMDLNYRLDGSSNFGKNQRMAPFGAIGLGWNIHKEKFFHYRFINQLKLRAGTGFTGSVSFPPYMGTTTYTYYTNQWYSTGIGAAVNNIGNNDLTWQKTTNYDAGLDLTMWDNRLSISPHYYYKYTRGLLSNISLAPSTGSDSKMANLGDMENRGWELQVKLVLVKNKQWNVSAFGNLTGNKNKIVKISNALKKYNDEADNAQTSDTYKGVPLLRYNEGQSTDAIYAVRSLGIDPESGKEMFLKRNGQTTYDWSVTDIMPIVDATPKAYGYFGSTVGYKNFLLTATMYTRFGGYDYNQTLVDRIENADPRYNVDQRVFDEKWKKPGDHTFYKNIADLGQTQTTSRFIQKDNVMELSSVYASYDFTKAALNRLGVKTLRVAVTMNDIWRSGSIKQERGLDYPFARSFTFSLQTRF